MTTNQWVEFVRKWAKKHKQTYMCAASKTKCREEYHAMKSKKTLGTKKRNPSSPSNKMRRTKKRMQSELLTKFKAYAKHRRNKGIVIE